MSVESLNGYGYSQYIANSGTTLAERAKPKNGNLCVDPKTGNIAYWDPKLYDPNREVKKDNTKRNIMLAGGTAATAALYFLTRGKIKNIPSIKGVGTWLKGVWTNKIKPLGTKVVNWFKNLFKRGKKTTPTPPNNKPEQLLLPAPNNKPQLLLPAPATNQAGQLLLPAPAVNTASTVATNTVTSGGTKALVTKVTPERLKGIDLKHVRNSHNRQMVQNALDDVVTEADLLAYRQANRYVAPTTEQAAAIRRINAEANRASAISRQVQNNLDDASLAALERFKMNLTA